MTVDAGAVLLDQLVDTKRYPLGQPTDPAYREARDLAQDQLAASGCARLPGFVRPDAVARMATETCARLELVDRTLDHHNPYFSEPAPDLPADDPRRHLATRNNAFLCRDRLPPESWLVQLYYQQPLRAFLEDCLGGEPLYLYDDPMANMLVNVQEPGTTFPWHFDTNETSISVMVQKPEAGGVFEYAPAIRSAAEENYDGVGRVLGGERAPVVELALEPGDLQIFKGRFSLHRVTAVEGARPRLMAIFGYTNTPGMVAKPGRVMKLFGRVHQGHLDAEAAALRRDGLNDG
ncbi:MAG: hypothetical protein AAF495_18825 [Pseudomonadota bacterium]